MPTCCRPGVPYLLCLRFVICWNFLSSPAMSPYPLCWSFDGTENTENLNKALTCGCGAILHLADNGLEFVLGEQVLLLE